MALKCKKYISYENLNRQCLQNAREGPDELDLNTCNQKCLIPHFSNIKDHKTPNLPTTSTYSASETQSTKGPQRSPVGKGKNKIINIECCSFSREQ